MIQSRWTQEVLEVVVNDKGERTYTAHKDAPSDGGYVAYFIDIKYKNSVKVKESSPLSGGDVPKDMPRRLEFSTQVSVFPDTYPFADCTGEGCRGKLV